MGYMGKPILIPFRLYLCGFLHFLCWSNTGNVENSFAAAVSGSYLTDGSATLQVISRTLDGVFKAAVNLCERGSRDCSEAPIGIRPCASATRKRAFRNRGESVSDTTVLMYKGSFLADLQRGWRNTNALPVISRARVKVIFIIEVRKSEQGEFMATIAIM